MVSEDYLEDKVKDIRMLVKRVAVLGKDQEKLNEVYEEMVKIMNDDAVEAHSCVCYYSE